MTKITPVGIKLLIEELGNKNQKTESGIELVNLVLSEGKVIEVSSYLKDIYSPGDVVLFPEGAGTQHTYNGKPCKFINGNEYPNGDVWAKISEDNPPKDKGDHL